MIMIKIKPFNFQGIGDRLDAAINFVMKWSRDHVLITSHKTKKKCFSESLYNAYNKIKKIFKNHF
jgi:hypothetical protein